MRILRIVLLSVALSTLSVAASATLIPLQASIDGAQANAGVGTGSAGTGSATMTFDTVSSLFSWSISWSGLTGPTTAAHFHGPALPNQNAGIEVTIGLPSPSIGSAVLGASQASDLLSDLWYINIHTASFPGGEIRGQVTVVPEPASFAMLALGLTLLAGARRRSA